MNNNSTKDRKTGQIELLAPAGNIEAGYAALHYGADAVYLGLSSFSARAHAVNLSVAELSDIAGYAHSLKRRRKIYVAVNTLVLQNELGALVDLLAAIADCEVDAVIVQDIGVLDILRRCFPRLKVHASTQMAVHNIYGVETAQKMGIARVTLARELTLAELARIAAQSEIETEVFIHGALCYSYSGLCLFSSHLHGRSGNRGQCAYPCREWFAPELSSGRPDHFEQKGGFIFSMKDLALPEYVTELQRIGVTALKIEGRMKSPLYVAAAVNYYRHLIDGGLSPAKERELAADVRTIFSRPWTDLYLRTRRNHAVVDAETQGHRGCPVGKVEGIIKHPGGHSLRFKTGLPLELHDGLQIDIAGLPRPFGFAVKNIGIVEGGRHSDKKRVFAAPAGSRVDIQLPRDHPILPLGAVIYSASSQKVKQRYDFFGPKPGQFRSRHAADFDIHVNAEGLDIIAASSVFSGIKTEKIRVEAKKHFEGLAQQAKNIGQADPAIAAAFGKLGNTSLSPGKITIDNPDNLFVPISLLNSARREIAAALEHEIAELSRQYALALKADIFPGLSAVERGKITSGLEDGARHKQTPKHGGFKWSIKTDQPHLLAAFGPDDWRDLDEIVVECSADASQDFIGQIERLSAVVDKTQIRLALPVILREWEMEAMAKTVSGLISTGWRKWQISNLGGWSFLHALETDRLDISADCPVYVMNSSAVSRLEALGIGKFTLSPENGLENMRALLEKHASNATVLVYQDTPLMISETCVFASKKCSYPHACNFREMMFSSARAGKIRMAHHGCRLVVLNNQPFCLGTHLAELAEAGAVFLRADFMYRVYSEKTMIDLWRRFRSGAEFSMGHTANFKRGLE